MDKTDEWHYLCIMCLFYAFPARHETLSPRGCYNCLPTLTTHNEITQSEIQEEESCSHISTLHQNEKKMYAYGMFYEYGYITLEVSVHICDSDVQNISTEDIRREEAHGM
jgi:hypothetical protein